MQHGNARFIGFLTIAGILTATCSTPAPTRGLTDQIDSDSGSLLTLEPPQRSEIDPVLLNQVNLDSYPVLPEVPNWIIRLYQAGQELGNNPQVFSVLGDSMTENPDFLKPIGAGEYNLGEYEHLQPVIKHFMGVPTRGAEWELDSFSDHGFAAARGFNVAGPLDPIWADPSWCEPGESPLACEYRVFRPSFAIIMFGTNDVQYVKQSDYEFHLRTIVYKTISHGVVPILNTFPEHPLEPERSVLYNKVVVRIATDYDIPLVNLYRGLEPLENHGVDIDDPQHLLLPIDGNAAHFDAEHLNAGATVRNLVTLQSLDIIWRAVTTN